jgi:hypothetical protein
MWIVSRNLLFGLAAAGMLWGCGSGQPAGGAARAPHAGPSAKKPVNPSQALLRSMVGAVPANRAADVPVQVKFQLRERPDVAQPVDVDLLIVPTAAHVDRISGQVQVDDGLELVDGAEIPPTDNPAEGVPITHGIKVLPKRDGIFTFSAMLSVDYGGHTATQTYSMPMIAGSGVTNLPAKPATPAVPTAATH